MKTSIRRKLLRAFRFLGNRQAWARIHRAAGTAIVAGGLMFAGTATATNVLTEDFEGTSPGIWDNGFGTYATGEDFSNSPHSGVPNGGAQYAHLIGIPDTITHTTIDFASTLTPDEVTAAQNGFARWNFDGWLAAYTANTDYAEFSIEFFDGANGTGNSVGSVILADGLSDNGVTEVVLSDGTLEAGKASWDLFNWSHYETSAPVSIGAVSAIVTYDGKSQGSNANDAYSDNLSLEIVDTGVAQFLSLVADPATGNMMIENTTGSAVDINFYQVLSVGESLDPNGWVSLDDQDVGAPGGDPTTESWTAGGGSDTGELVEALLLGASQLVDAEQMLLGAGYNESLDAKDLKFFFGLPDGSLHSGIVAYGSVPPIAGGEGDFDDSGSVDQGDLDLVLLNWGSPTVPDGWVNDLPTGPIGATELGLVKTNWGSSADVPAAQAVPEPSTCALLGLGLLVTLWGLHHRN